MSVKEQIARELNSLSKTELKQVVEYVAFLKFRAQIKPISASEEAEIAALYAEFAEEDRQLAEEGMSDYSEVLGKEDVQ